MLLVVDIGNTRTKWALADDSGKLSPMEICLNANIAKANFPTAQAQSAVIANVAGEAMAHQLTQLLQPLGVHFISPSVQACGVKNSYQNTLTTFQIQELSHDVQIFDQRPLSDTHTWRRDCRHYRCCAATSQAQNL